MPPLSRRSFLTATAAFPFAPALAAAPRRFAATTPVVVASGNGLRAVERAYADLTEHGADPCDAVVAGVGLVEDDPDDMSVGLGGLPNEDGVVQLDASVMHGPTHKAGAVAALERVKNPAQVALRVLRDTDHVLLVGAGALAFARACGFPEQDLLTDRAREAWLRWKRNLNPDDDLLDDDQRIGGDGGKTAAAHTWGTIHCAAVDGNGDLGACTTTSGLSWKLPGRVGDSPIVGAGMFVDNAIGAAGATGRGESVIQSCGAFQVVQRMAAGVDPERACLEALRWIAEHTRRPDLRNERGEPGFNCVFYALRKDGAFGAAAMRGQRDVAICDERGPRRERCAVLFPGEG